MHFSNTERQCSLKLRAVSAVLALMILLSMLFVGNAVSIKAKADTTGQTFYVAFYDPTSTDPNNNNWWDKDSEVGVWTWNTQSKKNMYYRLHYVYTHKFKDGNDEKEGRIYSFTANYDFDRFKLLRLWGEDKEFTTLDKATKFDDIVVGNVNVLDYNNNDGAVTSGNIGKRESWEFDLNGWSDTNRCFYLKTTKEYENSNPVYKYDGSGWGALTDAFGSDVKQNASSIYGSGSVIKGGITFPDAAVGYYNEAKQDYEVNNTKLFPVTATFYDYLTDNEMVNGWRTNSDYETSRTYLHRIPYFGWNKYLSGLSETYDWPYPLYFGNITSDYTNDMISVPYGTLRDKHIYSGSVDDVTAHEASAHVAHLRHENRISSYTDDDGLKNFSIFANDSESSKYLLGIQNYGGSVHGLVENELYGDNRDLCMTTNGAKKLISPFFSSNDFTNIVKTEFPMRVVKVPVAQSSETTYIMYEFDSMGMNEDINAKPDIVYFEYENGVPKKINYTNDQGMQMIDAFNALGGNNKDHRGFFPFDTGDGTGAAIAHDYGFGMRLEMEFNLTEDGMVYSTDKDGKFVQTQIPMQFTFEGDDDVWVFVDDKLALDLGGDHGNAKGSISFALNGKHDQNDPQSGPYSYVDYGAVLLKDTPVYGQNEYLKNDNKTDYFKDRIFTAADDFKTVDGNKVYNNAKKHTITVFYMERGLVESNLHLGFSVSPAPEIPDNYVTVEKKVDYSGIDQSVIGRVENYYNTNKDLFSFKTSDTVTEETKALGDGEFVEYKNKFEDGKKITVTESVADKDKYTYDTSYTVVDDFRKDIDKASAADYTVVSGKSGSSVSFDLATASTSSDKYNDFTVTAVNKVKLGSVGIKKEVPNSASDNSAFDFDYFVQLPGETSYPDKKDGTVTCVANSGEAKMLNLPVGSKVKFVEKMTDAQKSVYTADKAEVELTVGSKAAVETVKNTINSDKAVINAQKLLDGKASSVQFDFALTKVANGAKTEEVLTAKNGKNGAVSFTLENLQLKEKYTYVLEETSKSNDDYTCDTKKYLVEVDANADPISVKYYAVNGELEKGDEVAAADVTFKNTSKEKFGDVKVIKTGKDGKPLPDATIALAKAVKNGDAWEPAEDAKVQTDRTDENGEIMFTHLTPGDYVVYETQSASGHELLGEYVYVSVTENGVSTVEISDPDTRRMPRTGGIGALVMIPIGIALIALGIYILRPSKSKKKDT